MRTKKKTYPTRKTNAKKTSPAPFMKFRKAKWLESALAHPSFRNENVGLKYSHDFDRLEFFGDCVLNFVVCRKLFAKFPEADEGLLSRLRSILVSRKILSRIAREIKLTQHLKLGRGLEGQEDFLKAKIYADAFEAVIAAIYFDQGFDKTEKFLLKSFTGYFDIKKLFRLDPNPKSTLQELSQRHWQKLPQYQSEFHDGNFKTTVSLNRRKKGEASGRTRQEAEEKAARLLIRALRQDLLGRLKRTSSGKKLRKTF